LKIPFPEEGLGIDGLCVRLPRLDDLEKVAPAFQDPAVGGEAGLPPLDAEGLKAFHDTEMRALVDSGQLIPLLIEDTASGEILGGASIGHHEPTRQRIEIGYWLLESSRGRGIATRVARLLAEHVLANGIERVEAVARIENVASQRVLERAGFTREGVLRSLLRHDGRRCDAVLYSLLPGE
jgi:RimJ/RimL family protein N-acetyltransferase